MLAEPRRPCRGRPRRRSPPPPPRRRQRLSGPTTRTRGAERASRRCCRAPRATRELQDVAADGRPSAPRRARRLRRMVKASSSAWVGRPPCPSPALTTEQSHFRASRVHRAGLMMAHDNDVRPHGVERHRGVDEGSRPSSRWRLPTAMFMTSAPSRLPASSNED